MADSTNLALSLALVWAGVAAVLDIAYRKIPNWLTYSGIVAGLALRFAWLGPSGLWTGLAGGLFAGGIFAAFFLVRAMGGGDVKLMTALGCMVGFQDSIQLLVATAIAGGVLAVLFMIFKRRVGTTLKNVGSILKHHATSGVREHPSVNLDNPQAARMPYGVAIAAGALYCFSVAMFWR